MTTQKVYIQNELVTVTWTNFEFSCPFELFHSNPGVQPVKSLSTVFYDCILVILYTYLAGGKPKITASFKGSSKEMPVKTESELTLTNSVGADSDFHKVRHPYFEASN